MNKRGGVLAWFILIMVLLLLIIIAPIVYNFEKNKDCFEDIAEDFCDDNDMEVGDVWPANFECFNERQIEGDKYRFTKKEIKRCSE